MKVGGGALGQNHLGVWHWADAWDTHLALWGRGSWCRFGNGGQQGGRSMSLAQRGQSVFSMDVLSLSLESPEMDLHLNHSSSSGGYWLIWLWIYFSG